MPGFDERACERVRERRGEAKTKVTVGFGHQAVLSVAGTVVDAVKTGKVDEAAIKAEEGVEGE
eukprot:248183-Chlamydomonas_euryale.AAC.11